MNSEESRLRTFSNWPERAVVDARRIAKAGFYYMGQGEEVQCFSCGGRISDWNYGDSVMARHRNLDPNCPFVQNPQLSGNVPIVNERNSQNTSPNTSQGTQQLYRNERARLESFSTWPIRSVVSPELLAKSGFYYTQTKDKVRCAYCQGLVEKWEPGDDPDSEHRRHFPHCSFMRCKSLTDVNITHHPGISIRQSSVDNLYNGFETLKDLGVQDHRVPRHTKFATYDSRLNTFLQWPPSLAQKPEQLAEAGFYFTGRGDQVRCFHCDGGLRLWEREDEPWIEHARWFPECGFVLLIKGQEFVDEAIASSPLRLANIEHLIDFKSSKGPLKKVYSVTDEELQEQMHSESVLQALSMGLEGSRVKSALRQRLETVGQPFSTANDVVTAALGIQSEQTASADLEEAWATPPNSPNHDWRRVNPRRAENISDDDGLQTDEEEETEVSRDVRPPTVEPQTALPTNTSATPSNIAINKCEIKTEEPVKLTLEEENRRLKEARLCKVCMDSDVGIVFLPCRHLVTCALCAHSLADCPLCRQPIKATVRTFLS